MIPIKTFGEKLKAYRLAAGLTQEELANKCGMKKQNISRYEKTDREPNIRTAKALAQVLGVSLESLVNSETGKDFVKEHFNLQLFGGGEPDPELVRQHREVNEILDRMPPEVRIQAIAVLKALAPPEGSRDDS